MSGDPFFEPEPGEDGGPPLWAPGAREPLEPVTIQHVKRCSFKKKPNDPVTGKKRLGCLNCGKAKVHMDHWGHPPSFNAFGSGANQFTYQGQKHAWQDAIVEYLGAAGLPRGLGYVYVEGVMAFPTRTVPDQGNFKVIIEKATGDALQQGGWLEKDDWLHFEFGGIGHLYDKGQAWTRLEFMPSWDPAPMKEAGPEQGSLL